MSPTKLTDEEIIEKENQRRVKEVEDARGVETPDNVGSDTTDPDDPTNHQPSRFEYMEQQILDQFRRIYATDPEGVTRIMGVAVSDNGGKSYRLEADSTETDRFVGQVLWSKEFIESEVTQATNPVAKTVQAPAAPTKKSSRKRAIS